MSRLVDVPRGGDAAVIDSVRRGELRASARLISRIESGDTSLRPILNELYITGRDVPIIGITGPPGVGKSTLMDQLVTALRAERSSLGVLAVDPSSPFTGGAILGDRVRMARHNTDPGVFIRSMSSRGCMGGLAVAAKDALVVMASMGLDLLLVETVGVGQNEIDIMRFASTVVVLQPPAAGDEVQAIKAGGLEIGDIYAVTKSDLAGAQEMANRLREATGFRFTGGWRAPVLQLQATSGVGIPELVDALRQHQQYLDQHPTEYVQRRRSQLRVWLTELLTESLHLRYASAGGEGDAFERAIDNLLARRSSPHAAAAALFAAVGELK